MAHLSIAQQIKNATPTASGQGFAVYNINTNGQSQDVIKYNHSALTRMINQAQKYANKNGGNLPNTTFWNVTTSIFREDKVLFRELHQCKELLRLLKRNEIYDRNNPVVLTPTTPPNTNTGGTPVTTVPLNQPQNIDPQAVPEPASVMMLGMGLIISAVVGRRLTNRSTQKTAH